MIQNVSGIELRTQRKKAMNGGFVNISRPADYFTTCYTVLTRPNKVETAVGHCCNSWLSVWILSCRCPVKLSTQYQPCITVCWSFYFLRADQIFYRSYVNKQHFRLRSFASLCSSSEAALLLVSTKNRDLWPSSAQVQHRKFAIHVLPVTVRMLRVQSDKSDCILVPRAHHPSGLWQGSSFRELWFVRDSRT